MELCKAYHMCGVFFFYGRQLRRRYRCLPRVRFATLNGREGDVVNAI